MSVECKPIRLGHAADYHRCKRHCLPDPTEQPDGTIWQCSCGKWYQKVYSVSWIDYSKVVEWDLMTWWERYKVRRKL